MERVEERISELEDRTIEITQSEQLTKKKTGKKKKITEPWGFVPETKTKGLTFLLMSQNKRRKRTVLEKYSKK